MFLTTLRANDVRAVLKHHAFTLRAVRIQHGLLSVLREKDDLSRACLCHFCDQRICCIQHSCAMRGDAAQTAATTKAIRVGLNFFMVKAFVIGEGCKEN